METHEIQFLFFLNARNRRMEPTRIADKEKIMMGTLIVPGACKFSNPIPPPITSNNPPMNRTIPFFMIAKKFFTTHLSKLWCSYTIQNYGSEENRLMKRPILIDRLFVQISWCPKNLKELIERHWYGEKGFHRLLIPLAELTLEFSSYSLQSVTICYKALRLWEDLRFGEW